MSPPRLVPTLVLVACAVRAAALDSAADYWVRATPGLWFERLGGHVAYATGGGTPTDIGIDELGLDGQQSTPMIEAGAQIPFFGLYGGYFDFNESATRVITRTFDFANTTYTANDQVHSEVRLRDYYGELAARPSLGTNLFGFSVGLAVHGLAVRSDLQDQTSGQDGEFSKTVPVPVVAVRAHVTPISGLTFEARVHFLRFSHSGNTVKYGDFSGQVDWLPLHWLGITGGYRLVDIKADLDNVDSSGTEAHADLRLGGPFVGLIAKF